MHEIQWLIQRLESEKEACLQQGHTLAQGHRDDEADMMKVRANIYGIAASVCRAAQGQASTDPFAFVQCKIAAIPEAWRASHALAEQHNDHAKAAVERIKLETIAKISGMLTDLAEGNHDGH